MIKDEINIKDYEKIVEFITKVSNIETEFRSTILMNLSNFFGYNHLTFFLADRKGNFINPVTTNISPLLTETYSQYYHAKDIFHPVKAKNSKLGKSVTSISDIMPYSQFENTEYYRDFLRMDNLYYEVAVPLRVENDLLGGIGVFNPKELGDFTNRDILILEKVSKVISSSLSNYIKTKESWHEGELFRDVVSQSPTGVIVLKNNYTVGYYNSIAEEFCLDILKGKKSFNPIKYVISTLFIEGKIEKENSSKYIYKTINNYNFKIIPSILAGDFTGVESAIYIYISKNDFEGTRKVSLQCNNYNLTNREKEITDLVTKGFSNKQISQELFISYNTVKTHMENIMKKVGVENRTSLIYKINRKHF